MGNKLSTSKQNPNLAFVMNQFGGYYNLQIEDHLNYGEFNSVKILKESARRYGFKPYLSGDDTRIEELNAPIEDIVFNQQMCGSLGCIVGYKNKLYKVVTKPRFAYKNYILGHILAEFPCFMKSYGIYKSDAMVTKVQNEFNPKIPQTILNMTNISGRARCIEDFYNSYCNSVVNIEDLRCSVSLDDFLTNQIINLIQLPEDPMYTQLSDSNREWILMSECRMPQP